MAELMDTPMTRAQRIEAIRSFVAERLFRQPDEVRLDSRLVIDLGADSLDFVDFQFQLEKRFGIQFNKGEFFDFSSGMVTREGYLRKEAVEQLAAWIPALKKATDPARVPWADLLNVLTVETLLGIVEKKLGLAASGPSGGKCS